MIALTVIGGFLGAGKTTLLNRILRERSGPRLAVLVNDFGAINIDAELVESREGDMVRLENGCICCSVGGDFIGALALLRDRPDPPEHVVVEASGVADPGAIAVLGDMPGYRRDAAVVVVDAETVRERAADDATRHHVLAQLRAADLLVVNKADLVAPAQLAQTRAWLREITGPSTAIVETAFGEVPADVILGRPPADRPPRAHDHDGHDHSHPAFQTWSWSGEAPLSGAGLVEELKALPDGIVRAKGLLHLREDPANRYVLHVVGRRFSIEADRPWDDAAPASRLVVIGLPGSVDEQRLDAALERLAAPAPIEARKVTGMAEVGTTAEASLERRLEEHRRGLTGYCYRMLGSAFEAEDAVQETMLRAWRSIDSFEERAALKSWLYRIATNVCLDMLAGTKRRARPMDLGPAGTTDGALGTLPEATWIEPMPDGRMLAGDADPAELAERRETLRLAFIAALQHLPARQRAVLIFREVLRWKAAEVAELLGTSVQSVNSSLQRARAALATSDLSPAVASPPLAEDERALLDRYVSAFEAYDIDSLVALLHEDATLSMPPYELWLQGRLDVGEWFLGRGIGCRGSVLVPVSANGAPGFGQYRPSGPGGSHEPWALQVIDVEDGRIARINAFLDTARLFPLFGLPQSPPN